VGRDYSRDYLGGDETAFCDEDFMRISHLQYESDMDALKKANRVCFFDSCAVTTLYYSNLYLGHEVETVKRYIDPSRYDLVLFMSPDVKWVPDGLRFKGNQDERWRLHKILKDLYLNAGFDPNKIVDVSGNYAQRLDTILNTIDSIMGKP
jgi:HTH-type transcriptional repressor of NAD biosynthesis genes